MAAWMTDNAVKRLTENFHITPKDLVVLIDKRLFVEIGRESKDVVHVLFYIEIDETWLVAVMDERRESIITVWPHTYGLRFPPSEEAKEEAKKLIEQS